MDISIRTHDGPLYTETTLDESSGYGSALCQNKHSTGSLYAVASLTKEAEGNMNPRDGLGKYVRGPYIYSTAESTTQQRR